MKIWCVMVSRSIPWYISDQLYEAARKMAKEGLTTFDLKSDVCEGRVTTEYESMMLVYASGFGFHATVEWEVYKAKVTYIICSKDLLPGEKTRRQSVPLFDPSDTHTVN